MINHGSKQSAYIIIDNRKGCSHRYIRRLAENIGMGAKESMPIKEVWVYENEKLMLVFKQTEG